MQPVSMLNTLYELYDLIIEERIKIQNTINHCSELESTVFDAPIHIDAELINLKKLWGRHGFYFFMFNEAFDMKKADVRKWNSLSGASFVQVENKFFSEVDCLYLGSCVSISMYSRIKQHYSEDGSFTALKLKNSKRRILLNEVRCLAFPIKKEYPETLYRILLPALEKEMHKEMYTQCGSTRV